MREPLVEKTKTVSWCIWGCLIVAIFLIIILGLISFVPGIDLEGEKIPENIIRIHAASIIVLTILLIAVAWLQLGELNKTSKADFLLRIDDRYSSPEIIKARVLIQELYRKTTTAGQPYIEDEVTKKIAEEIKIIGKESSKESCEKFIYLLNLLDFLETIAYFSNKGFISVKEINELLGNTIFFNYKIFKSWISYRREKYQNNSYYCELETLVKTIAKHEGKLI